MHREAGAGENRRGFVASLAACAIVSTIVPSTLVKRDWSAFPIGGTYNVVWQLGASFTPPDASLVELLKTDKPFELEGAWFEVVEKYSEIILSLRLEGADESQALQNPVTFAYALVKRIA